MDIASTDDAEAPMRRECDPPQQSCAKKLSRRSKCAICGAISVLILATIALLGAFVVGPNIAKTALDASEITFTKLTMSNPQNFTFTTQADLTISKVAPLGCSIGAMELHVMYEDVEVGTLQMPSMDVDAYKDNHKSVEQSTFRVTNVDAWNAFSSAMLRKDTVTWRLKSKVDITAMGVTFRGIDFDKHIPLSCFRGLDDVQMDVFNMSRSTPSKLVVDMTVCMRNPSDIAITSLGDVFFGIYYMGEYMGNVTATDSSVSVTRNDASNGNCKRFDSHGYNLLTMSGTLHPQNRSVADTLISRYLSNRSSNVTARALSPANSLPLFNQGMQNLTLATTLDGNDNPLIVGLDMLNAMMTPVDNDAVSMKMLAKVHVGSPLGDHSSMQIFQVAMSVDMRYAGNVVGTITTPLSGVPPPNTITGHGAFDVPVASASMSLRSQGENLAALAKDLINKNSLNMSLSGHSNCTVLAAALGYNMTIVGIPIELPNLAARPPLGYITVAGMGGLPDVSVMEHRIPGIVPPEPSGCQKECGLQLTATVRLNNPSPFGLYVGTLNSQVRTLDGVTLGNISATGLTLSPGENVIPMSGKLFATSDNAQATAKFLSNYMNKTQQPTKVIGINAGDSQSKWLHEAVRSMALTVQFPGAEQDFKVLTEIEVQTMKMAFQENDKPPTLAGTIRAKMNMPKTVDRSIIQEVKSSTIQFEMADVDSGKSCARLTVQSAVQYNSQDGTITASFEESDVTVTDITGFQNLVKDLLLSEKKQVLMRGLLSPTININMGDMQLQDIYFEGQTSLLGFNAFMDGEKSLMTIQGELDVLGGKDGVVSLQANADVVNPSNVAVSMGRIVLELWSEDGHKVSDMTVDNFALAAGPNKATSFVGVKATYDVAAAGQAGRKFLSTYAVGEDQTVSIHGTSDGTSIELLKPALAALTGMTRTIVPGLPYPKNRLLNSSLMHLPRNPFKLTDIPTDLKVQNPFSIPITFKTAFCNVTACQTYAAQGCEAAGYYADPVGYYTPDLIDEVVKGQETKVLNSHMVRMNGLLRRDAIQTLLKSLGRKGAVIRLSGNMTLGIGENTVVTVDYHERDVPVHLSFFSGEKEAIV